MRIITGEDIDGALTYPALRSLAPILSVGTVEAIAIVMVEPSLYAAIADAAPVAARGRAMSLGGLSHFGGAAVGAAGLGSLYGVREGLPFWIAGTIVLAVAATCALLIPARGRLLSDAADVAEAGDLALDVVDDGNDVGRPHVDRPVVAGELDEVLG